MATVERDSSRKSQDVILVTGGCGFVGSNLVKQLLENGYHVRIMDLVDVYNHPRYVNDILRPLLDSPLLSYVRGDVTNYRDVCNAINPTEYPLSLFDQTYNCGRATMTFNAVTATMGLENNDSNNGNNYNDHNNNNNNNNNNTNNNNNNNTLDKEINNNNSNKQEDKNYTEMMSQIDEMGMGYGNNTNYYVSRRVSCIFHVAALTDPWGNPSLYTKVNIEGTRNIIDACHEFNITKLIYTSSSAVVMDGKDCQNGDESMKYPKRHLDCYGYSKKEAEKLVIAANDSECSDKKHRLYSLALRPHNIFGPGDTHFIAQLIRKAKSGDITHMIGEGHNVADFTYIDNVIDAHIMAMEKLNEKIQKYKSKLKKTKLALKNKNHKNHKNGKSKSKHKNKLKNKDNKTASYESLSSTMSNGNNGKNFSNSTDNLSNLTNNNNINTNSDASANNMNDLIGSSMEGIAAPAVTTTTTSANMNGEMNIMDTNKNNDNSNNNENNNNNNKPSSNGSSKKHSKTETGTEGKSKNKSRNSRMNLFDMATVGAPAGQVYFITNGEPTLFWSFLVKMLEKMHCSTPQKYISFNVAYALAWLMELFYWLFGWLFGWRPLITRQMVVTMACHHWFSHDKATRDFGYKPHVSLEEGLKRTAKWFLTHNNSNNYRIPNSNSHLSLTGGGGGGVGIASTALATIGNSGAGGSVTSLSKLGSFGSLNNLSKAAAATASLTAAKYAARQKQQQKQHHHQQLKQRLLQRQQQQQLQQQQQQQPQQARNEQQEIMMSGAEPQTQDHEIQYDEILTEARSNVENNQNNGNKENGKNEKNNVTNSVASGFDDEKMIEPMETANETQHDGIANH